MKYILITSLVFLCGLKSYTQTTFKPGYYITPHQDTIQGLIKDYDWRGNPDQINFKASKMELKELFWLKTSFSLKF
jgi:hypothetical protein